MSYRLRRGSQGRSMASKITSTRYTMPPTKRPNAISPWPGSPVIERVANPDSNRVR